METEKRIAAWIWRRRASIFPSSRDSYITALRQRWSKSEHKKHPIVLAIGCFFAFVIELSANVRRKDEIEYIEDRDEEYKEIDNEEAEIGAIAGSVTNGAQAQSAQYKKESEQLSVSDDVFFEVAQASIENGSGDYDDVDTSDFIYGTVPEDDDFILPVDSDAVNEYDAPMEPSESADMYITKADSTYDEEEDSSNMEYTDSRMDRIDRLILEITEDDVI